MSRTGAGSRWPRRSCALALLSLVSGGAGAQEPPPVAAAEALFRAGTSMMQQGRASEACPRLEESFRLDPAGATAQALGRCYELTGRPATAWARYTVALSFARRRSRPDRERDIEARLADLEPRMAWLKVTVAPGVASLPSLRVSFDGEALGPGSWGLELPTDPGAHALVVEAPGRERLARSLELLEGQHEAVVIDRLEGAPRPAASASPPAPAPSASVAASSSQQSPAATSSTQAPSPPEARSLRPRDRVALGLGAGGALLSVVGGALVVKATTQAVEAQSMCFPTCNEGGGSARYQQSLTTRRWAAAAFAGGGALLVGGLFLWVTGPAQVSVSSSPGGGGVSVEGRF